MVRDFYLALAPVSFTLLGLWVIVVQTRHAEWRGRAEYRRRAYGVWLQFALPGLMGLLALVDPASEALWRVSFAIVALVGVAVLSVLWIRERRGRGRLTYTGTALLYAAVAFIAIDPAVVNHFDSSINALRTEAILLSILVFIGVNVAWYLLFEDVREAS